jgi:hypothetical protein
MYSAPCTPPPPSRYDQLGPSPPTNERPGIIRQPFMQNTEAAGRWWEVAYSGNITCKCDLRGQNTVNQRIIYHQFNRTGKSHATWETLQVF